MELEMTIIKSISEIRKKTHEVAEHFRSKDKPIYITKNGRVDLVIMSLKHYERLLAENDLYEKLSVAQVQSAKGEKGITQIQLIKKIRKEINAH